MAIQKYVNPELLPDDVDEASTNFFLWLESKSAEFNAIHEDITPTHTIIEVSGGVRPTYYVSGGIVTNTRK